MTKELDNPTEPTALDFFAGMALAGLLASKLYATEGAVEKSYTIAQAMLEERKKYL